MSDEYSSFMGTYWDVVHDCQDNGVPLPESLTSPEDIFVSTWEQASELASDLIHAIAEAGLIAGDIYHLVKGLLVFPPVNKKGKGVKSTLDSYQQFLNCGYPSP